MHHSSWQGMLLRGCSKWCKLKDWHAKPGIASPWRLADNPKPLRLAVVVRISTNGEKIAVTEVAGTQAFLPLYADQFNAYVACDCYIDGSQSRILKLTSKRFPRHFSIFDPNDPISLPSLQLDIASH